MLRAILNTVPTGLLVVAVVGVTCGSVVLAVWLIRRRVPATREEFNSEIVAAMLGVLAARGRRASRHRARQPGRRGASTRTRSGSSTRRSMPAATGSPMHAARCRRRSPR